MAYELPPLPFEYTALEPYITADMLKFHHDKHHATYVTNLNAAVANRPEVAAKPVEELIRHLASVPEEIRTAVKNNGGGHLNHAIFWTLMGKIGEPGIGGEPIGPIAEQIKADFGDYAAFKKAFNETTAKQFGSGWGWLVYEGGKLKIMTTANQESPLTQGLYPILLNEVREHAYYLGWQNRRADYLADWWNLVNWNEVNKRFATAKG